MTFKHLLDTVLEPAVRMMDADRDITLLRVDVIGRCGGGRACASRRGERISDIGRGNAGRRRKLPRDVLFSLKLRRTARIDGRSVAYRVAMPIPCRAVTAPQFPLFTSHLRLLRFVACLCVLPLTGTVDAWGAQAGPHPAQALVDRAEAGARSDPGASSRDARAALELLAIRPNADLEIEARILLCDHLSERDRNAAEEQAAKARAQLPKATRLGLLSGILACEGTILETAGDNVQARVRYDQAVRVADETADREMLAGALYARGYLFGLQGQYAAGLTDLKRAQALYDEIGLTYYAITTLNSIAILYNRMGDYAQAREIYARALEGQRAAQMHREVSVTLHNLGRAHEKLEQWAAARTAFQESADISRQLGYQRGEAYALRGLAAVANGLNDPQGALTILERASELQQQTPDARLNALIELARGAALHQRKQLPASDRALRAALRVFSEGEQLHELKETCTHLAQVASEMGNWRDAYVFRMRAQETSEAMFRNQLDQRFASLKVEFDTAAKEKENALLSRENEANQKALEHERRARSLQATAIVLAVILAVLLAVLAVHQWRTTHRMRALAMTDDLTGAPNRRAVLTQLGPMLASNTPCAMLIIDIDHFKSINDQHGHPEGDEALRLVAQKLSSLVQAPALLGRLGGEEFVVVLPGASQEAAMQAAEGIRVAVMTIDTRRWLAEHRITVSIGVTTSTRGDTPSSMLQRADNALYEAKRAGRNRVKTQTPRSDVTASGKASPAAGASEVEFA